MTSDHREKLFKNQLSNVIILRYSKKLVELADSYYKYGTPILNKIPSEIGNGLKITTRIYREIGLKIYKRKIYHERMYTTEWEKITLLLNKNNKPFVGNQIMPLNPTQYLLECKKITDNNVHNKYVNSDYSIGGKTSRRDEKLTDIDEESIDSDEESLYSEEVLSDSYSTINKKQNINLSKKKFFILLIFVPIIIKKMHNKIIKYFSNTDKKNIIECEQLFVEG